jgi:dTDP-4-amino-4,6-dideoxygalactose transaminase
MGTDHIPFLDLITPHRELEEELVTAFRRALRDAAFIGGPVVDSLEREFAEFCGTRHAVGVGSGTDALRFALKATGIRSGDIVITVPLTFIATTEAISQVGARPVFVDVEACTLTLSPERLRDFLESQCVRDAGGGRARHRETGRPVTAVVPVHLYGQCADMDAILDIADDYGLVVIEDACQAHGAEYHSRRTGRWEKAGSMGAAAAFSFYPGKNLGACGEAGAITTNDPTMAAAARMLRDHGQSRKYHHQMEGYNGRLDAIQAAFLSVKLRRLSDWNRQRQGCARRYDELLKSIPGVTIPFAPSWSRPVYHLYVIQVEDRVAVQRQLDKAGIGTGFHYPIALHQQDAYRSFGHCAGAFPISEHAAAHVLSLPMFPGLTADQQERVAAELTRIVVATEIGSPS